MRSRILAGSVVSSHPATRAVPPLGGMIVASMRSVVVLPAPLGPRKPKISPACTRRSTPSTATTSRCRDLKTRRKPCVSITASAAVPIRRDSGGCRDRGAGQQLPERLLRRPAACAPAHGAYGADHRRHGQPFHLTSDQVAGDRAFGKRAETQPGEEGGPHVLRMAE